MGSERLDEGQQRVAHLLVIALLVSLEPLALIVGLELAEKLEQLGIHSAQDSHDRLIHLPGPDRTGREAIEVTSFLVGTQRLTREEFWRLPRHLGWRYEYLDGVARIEPGACCVVASLELRVGHPSAGQAPRPSQSETLWPLCLAAFGPSVEYAGYSPEQAENAARESIATYFEGERGQPRPESVVLEEHGRPLAAALLVETVTGPHLDLLFVAPDHHRRGLAAVAVGACCRQLLESGETHLTSAYQLANLPSAAWHRKFGFREYPDRLSEQMRRYFLISELERLRRVGSLTCQQEVRLRFARRRCSQLLAHLDAMLEQERYDEAYTVAHVLTPARRGERRRPLPQCQTK